jgi:hypothetical protein
MEDTRDDVRLLAEPVASAGTHPATPVSESAPPTLGKRPRSSTRSSSPRGPTLRPLPHVAQA